jgi:hypothetical protein
MRQLFLAQNTGNVLPDLGNEAGSVLLILQIDG